MIRIYAENEYQSMPWKNGQGITRELLIEPACARFPHDLFCWRLSSARILTSGPFSKFSGYQRLLMMIEGQGFSLNAKVLKPFEGISFSGDESMWAKINFPILDLGFIFDPKQVKAEMDFRLLQKDEKLILYPQQNDTLLFYWKTGSGIILDQEISCGQTARAEKNSQIEIESQSASELIYVTIKPKA
jgi:environmental stress-induced protein Ves